MEDLEAKNSPTQKEPADLSLAVRIGKVHAQLVGMFGIDS